MTTQTLLRMSNKDFHAHCAEVYKGIEKLEREKAGIYEDSETYAPFPQLQERAFRAAGTKAGAARRLKIWIKKVIIAKYTLQ